MLETKEISLNALSYINAMNTIISDLGNKGTYTENDLFDGKGDIYIKELMTNDVSYMRFKCITDMRYSENIFKLIYGEYFKLFSNREVKLTNAECFNCALMLTIASNNDLYTKTMKLLKSIDKEYCNFVLKETDTLFK